VEQEPNRELNRCVYCVYLVFFIVFCIVLSGQLAARVIANDLLTYLLKCLRFQDAVVRM